MKIITLNLKSKYKSAKSLFKIALIVILAVSLLNVFASAYLKSKLYEATISDITEKKTIILDAGHGGEDCGAIGANGIYEKDLNLDITNQLGKLLSEAGFAVIYTRTTDALLYSESENIKGIRKISDLKNRCKIGAEYPNAIYISVHMNSYRNPIYSGLQVYYSLKNEASSALAGAVQSSVKESLQTDNNRKIKPGNDIYLMENLENPAILIECGFLTNKSECNKLCQKEYQKQLCFSIYCGIIKYMN